MARIDIFNYLFVPPNCFIFIKPFTLMSVAKTTQIISMSVDPSLFQKKLNLTEFYIESLSILQLLLLSSGYLFLR